MFEETQNYITWRITHTAPIVNGAILNLQVPPVVTDKFGGSQTGTITIKNTGSYTANAIAHVYILGLEPPEF